MPEVGREEWNRRWRAHWRHVHADDSRVLCDEVGGLAPGRALDLACGSGRNAVWLAERGWRVTAVDFSDVALAEARRSACERGVEVEWVEADVRDYEPSPGTFDLVLVFFLHLPPHERRSVLGRAAAAVARGGTLLLAGHDLANLATEACGPSDPAVLYVPEEVARELPGLAIEKAESVTRTVETEQGETRAVDTLVRASRPVPD
jgi:2-polyprenyl-3-methyl-5-hydroxy-6-metoxy-1,4-benzoquinol methylase